jgi:hypothetical protein
MSNRPDSKYIIFTDPIEEESFKRKKSIYIKSFTLLGIPLPD